MKIRSSTIRTLLISFSLFIAHQSSTNAQSACVYDIKTAEINKTTFHYIECGTGEPLVFVHGTIGDYRSWIGQIGPFSEKYRVISYSRRYHYPNPWPQNDSDFSVNIHAEDLAAFIQTLNLGKVHIIGHSYGAHTALLVARENPELVRSLTLGEPPVMSLLLASSQGDSLFQNFIQSSIIPSYKAFKKGKIEDGIQLFVDGVLGNGVYEKMPPIAHIFMLENARELMGEINGMNNKDVNFFPAFSCGDAEKIAIPTLLLEGELSPRFFGLINDDLERCLPNSERAVIPEASHDLKIQEPNVLNEKILPFLKGQ